MIKPNFEEYLQEQFTDTEPQVLDDDLPDAFDSWLQDLDVQELMDYGQQYAERIFKLFTITK